MIKNSCVNIPIIENLTSEYIENFFNDNNLNVLRWAIVGRDEANYFVNVSVIE